MTLVIHHATPEWVRYAIDTDAKEAARCVHRCTLVKYRDQLDAGITERVYLAGWTLDETDVATLIEATADAARRVQERYDVRMETLHDRAEQWHHG